MGFKRDGDHDVSVSVHLTQTFIVICDQMLREESGYVKRIWGKSWETELPHVFFSLKSFRCKTKLLILRNKKVPHTSPLIIFFCLIEVQPALSYCNPFNQEN